MVGDGRWLTVSEIVDRFRDAGYPDSINKIRRMVDRGDFPEWYADAGSGYRYVAATSVAEVLAERKRKQMERERGQVEGGTDA